MSEYKIDKGVPIPKQKSGSRKGERRGCRKPIYPFGEMCIGDSIFRVGSHYADTKGIQVAAAQYKHLHIGWDYISRRVTENGIKGLRIWRIA